MADFGPVFERGFAMGHDFVRMLLPDRGRGQRLDEAARYLSPVEWVGPGFPPTFISSSERDFLYRANRNLAARLREHGVEVDALFLGREARAARHTWQQDAAHQHSPVVYERLQAFVRRVCGGVPAATAATVEEAA
jgi:acetyl esterase/lipase